MPSVYPTSLDSFDTKVDGVSDILADDMNRLQAAVMAIEARMGVTNSSVTTSHDYRLRYFEAGFSAKPVRMYTFSSSVTYTPVAGTTKVYFFVVGATGSVYRSSTQTTAGAGGAGFAFKIVTAPTGPFNITIGAAGATGGAGGTTTISGTGLTNPISVTGSGGVSTSGTPGAGGVATYGDFNANGGSGGSSTPWAANYCGGGGGGGGAGSFAGTGGAGGNVTTINSGGGGGGGLGGNAGTNSSSTTSKAGGAGASSYISGDIPYVLASNGAPLTSNGGTASGAYGSTAYSGYGGYGGKGAPSPVYNVTCSLSVPSVGGGMGGFGGGGSASGVPNPGSVTVWEFET